MSIKTNMLRIWRHVTNDGLPTGETHQQTAAPAARVVDDDPAIVLGPFNGDYEFVAIDNAVPLNGTPDNMVYAFGRTAAEALAGCVAANSHIWDAARTGRSVLRESFESDTNEGRPYIAFRVIAAGKTNRISVRRLKSG